MNETTIKLYKSAQMKAWHEAGVTVPEKQSIFTDENTVTHNFNDETILIENLGPTIPTRHNFPPNNQTISQNSKYLNEPNTITVGSNAGSEDDSTSSGPDVSSMGKESFDCKYCEKSYTSRSNLNSHLRKLHNEKWVKLLEKRKDKPRLHKRTKKVAEKDVYNDRYSCEFCAAAYTSKTGLYHHLKRWHPEKVLSSIKFQLMCSICSERFPSQLELESHQQNQHPEYWKIKQIEQRARFKNTTCTICGKQFRHRNKLETHMHTHTGTHPYNCEICGVGVASSTNLKRHMLIHTKAYPYKCEICDQGFRDENKYMEQHCQKHHPELYANWRLAKGK